MTTLMRCDECKRLSDEQGVGHIGREHTVYKYRDTLMIIRTVGRDLCPDCIKKIVADSPIKDSNED